MILKELINLHEAKIKVSIADSLKSMKEGDRLEGKLLAFFEKLSAKAEKSGLAMVLNDPDNFSLDYDVKSSEIRSGANVWAQHIDVHANGFLVHINVDVDDIGGDSQNHEEVQLDLAGKEFSGDLGGKICTIDADEYEIDEMHT